MTYLLRSPCGDDCIHPSHRLSEMLAVTEARNARLETENALLESENHRLAQEVDRLHGMHWTDISRPVREAWAVVLGLEDRNMELQSALLAEQRKGESLLSRVEFLKADIRKIQAEKVASSIQHLESEGHDLMTGYSDGLAS